MSDERLNRWIRLACLLALLALAMIAWSLLDPTPVPVIVSMTLGQIIGTISFGMYLFVVLIDVRRAARERRKVLAASKGGADEK